ncbi:hypothetical protein NEHOM01_0797 [Nematocida homosporus]|uniref:uncharacterized protein n=1 Tax=Nematocida homosporus TaxID=1912981 RepID=UPI00222087C3|nr:uncharacterized protein NEHOM01_0797 [Nematocida homosporus]KAI5185382.1 hypothetical protein NEHOM01_0797 [Nematocida homosporus]
MGMAMEIDPTTCSDDLLYCFDKNTDSIVKTGTRLASGASALADPNSPSQCKVLGVTEVVPAVPGLAQEIKRTIPVSAVTSNSLPSSSTYANYSTSYSTPNTNSTSYSTPNYSTYSTPSSAYSNYSYPSTYSSYSTPTYASGYSSLGSANPKVSVTPDKVCVDRPKQRYVNVQCCQQQSYPVATPPDSDPCICEPGAYPVSFGTANPNNSPFSSSNYSSILIADINNIMRVKQLL